MMPSRCFTHAPGRRLESALKSKSGGGYLSYYYSRIVLGLGKRERIDGLEVKWPLLGGETQRFKDIAIDRYIAIVESEEKWK